MHFPFLAFNHDFSFDILYWKIGVGCVGKSALAVNHLELFPCAAGVLIWAIMLWQPLITKTNDHTSNKSLRMDIKWEFHKRTWQGVSAKLESYIYRIHMVHATSLCLPHFLLKATMLCTCVLTSSSRSFYYVLGLWHHIMWLAMSHASSLSLKEKEKEIQKKRNIKSRKIDKIKRKMLVSKVFHNSTPLLRFHFQRNFFFVPPDPLTLLLIFLIPFQTFFQFLHIFILPFFPIILPPIPILL